ncbi:MAG: ATP synthase subunit I [Deltaproteobacteria bacterium]|nr:ATP synthase subunit I [Deltaproteobacteria bacterium]
MNPDPNKALGGIEKLTLVLYTALALGSLVFRDPDITVGVLVGGAFVLINFRLLRLIAGAAFRDPQNPRPGYLLLLVPKFTVIGALLWLIVKSGWFNIAAFAAGTSCLIVAIILSGLRAGGAETESGESAV